MMLGLPRSAAQIGSCRFCDAYEGTMRELVLPHERLVLCMACINDLCRVLAFVARPNWRGLLKGVSGQLLDHELEGEWVIELRREIDRYLEQD